MMDVDDPIDQRVSFSYVSYILSTFFWLYFHLTRLPIHLKITQLTGIHFKETIFPPVSSRVKSNQRTPQELLKCCLKMMMW